MDKVAIYYYLMTKTNLKILNELAEQHIPEGVHKLLHIDSRKAWVVLMSNLVKGGFLIKKYETLKKCAVNWEALLTQKYSTQN